LQVVEKAVANFTAEKNIYELIVTLTFDNITKPSEVNAFRATHHNEAIFIITLPE